MGSVIRLASATAFGALLASGAVAVSSHIDISGFGLQPVSKAEATSTSSSAYRMPAVAPAQGPDAAFKALLDSYAARASSSTATPSVATTAAPEAPQSGTDDPVPVAIGSVIDQSPSEAAAADDNAAVAELLNRAAEQVRALRLTTPAHDNAYDTYQEILAKVPGHPEALAGLAEIGVRYVDLSRSATARGDMDKAALYAGKAEDIAPTAPAVQALIAERQQAALRPAEPAAIDELAPAQTEANVNVYPAPPAGQMAALPTAESASDSQTAPATGGPISLLRAPR